MATNMMPGAMPQGSQNSFLQPQPAIYPTAYPAAPNVGAVQARPRTIPGRMIYSPDEIMPQEVANNILKTYGMTKDQAMSQAFKFFGIRK